MEAKKIVITGGATRIGSAIAKSLAGYDIDITIHFNKSKSLAQKLKDGGIIFEDFTSRYEYSNDKLRLVDSLIKGSELGLSFDTVVGLDNDFFLTTGTIIPAYTLNTLITNFPIVGDIITAGSPEDGLLGASFKIEKKDGEFDMTYNPISVFVPNLFKNFLAN